LHKRKLFGIYYSVYTKSTRFVNCQLCAQVAGRHVRLSTSSHVSLIRSALTFCYTVMELYIVMMDLMK